MEGESERIGVQNLASTVHAGQLCASSYVVWSSDRAVTGGYPPWAGEGEVCGRAEAAVWVVYMVVLGARKCKASECDMIAQSHCPGIVVGSHNPTSLAIECFP